MILLRRVRELLNARRLHGDVSKLWGNARGVAGNAAYLEGDLTSLSGDISGIRGRIDGLRGDVSSIAGTVTDLRGDASQLAGDVTGLRGEISGLQGNVSKLEGDASRVWGDVSAICGDVSDLSGDLSGLRGDVTRLTGDVSELVGDVELITGSVDSSFPIRRRLKDLADPEREKTRYAIEITAQLVRKSLKLMIDDAVLISIDATESDGKTKIAEPARVARVVTEALSENEILQAVGLLEVTAEGDKAVITFADTLEHKIRETSTSVTVTRVKTEAEKQAEAEAAKQAAAKAKADAEAVAEARRQARADARKKRYVLAFRNRKKPVGNKIEIRIDGEKVASVDIEDAKAARSYLRKMAGLAAEALERDGGSHGVEQARAEGEKVRVKLADDRPRRIQVTYMRATEEAGA